MKIHNRNCFNFSLGFVKKPISTSPVLENALLDLKCNFTIDFILTSLNIITFQMMVKVVIPTRHQTPYRQNHLMQEMVSWIQTITRQPIKRQNTVLKATNHNRETTTNQITAMPQSTNGIQQKNLKIKWFRNG